MSKGAGRVTGVGVAKAVRGVEDTSAGADPARGGRGRRDLALLATAGICLLLTLLGGLTAPPATAAPADDTPTQAAALADRLRDDPIYVSDQLPREIPRSTAPDFAKLAKRTGVPTYVLVLPDQGIGGDRLLGAVHDRLGRDGLYVLVDYMGVTDAEAFGVRAPADDAYTVSLYELPHDAGPLRTFERFVDVVAQGREKAAQRAEAARKKYGGDSGEEAAEMHIDPVDRDNQSFATGIALTGVPLIILAISPYVRRWRRRVTAAPAPPQTAAQKRHFTPLRVEAGLAALAAVAIALSATLVFDQETSSASPQPTAADLSTRVERVADGLKRSPVYSDPESPRVLDARQLRELRGQIKDFDRGPVFVALVPQLTEDESAGEPEIFVEAVRKRIGAAGERGVYVVADPLGGYIDVVTYDVRIDANLVAFEIPDSLRYGDDDDRSRDHQLGQRLGKLMTLLDDAPRVKQPETSSLGMDDAPEPVEDGELASLFSGDFWPGLLVGAFAAGILFGVVASLLGITRLAVPSLRRPRANTTSASATSHPEFDAPPAPSLDFLRRTARDELDALGREFDPDAALRSSLRTRVWDCLDAATLLVDRDPDGHVDDDATPSDLAAAIVLARTGRAVLAGADKPCCALNPLHGPATGWRDAQYAPEEQRLRTIPVCAQCRVLVGAQPRQAHTLRLTLPGSARFVRVPYEEAPGPLPSIQQGIPQLIRQVREYAGVQ
ncbi:hypothetical protein AB0O76_10795 [Streptomyces sp. NPDC086554]|uniref:hypothetical protein n=1 Tax=Streptomyces sp. NPDC086554 TaxID=3154864 RepID=UPI00341587D8